jgi:hypothetical protein
MSDDATDLARRIGLKGPNMLKQLRRMIRQLLDRHRDAAALFLDRDGNLTPPARRWFADLADRNFVNRGCWHSDPREHAKREGRRELALEIINSARLDVGRLEALSRLEREVE